MTEKAAAALLGSLGMFFTLSNAVLAMLLRQYNEAPPKEMSNERKARMRRKFDRRLSVTWWRYGLSTFASLVAVLCYLLMTYGPPYVPRDVVFGVGFAAILQGPLLALLAVCEARRAARVTRELVAELERRKRVNENLERLEAAANHGG